MPMHPLTRHITQNNNVTWSNYLPLTLGGKDVGRVHRNVATTLCDAKLLVEINQTLFLKDESPDVEGRTGQLRTILHHLIEKKFVAKERFELYSIAPSFKDAPVALADRALIPALGFMAHGVHCNGYVKQDSGVHLWVGKRSADRTTDPGKYDHMVAGGQPHGLTVFENLAKEGHEEAGVPAHIIKHARAVGCITYARAVPNGVRRDVLFLFDLKCPEDFTPHNQDGEVENFHLMPEQDVLRLIHTTDDFKFNVNLVLIDFFIRHGIIKSDEAGYAELCAGLHAPLMAS
jgi:hypothetical protein